MPGRPKIIIALSGNPNSGKTTLFNALTGARQHIANYPGVTVEKKTGRLNYKGQEIEVVDLPGTYSLTAFSLEEVVARDFLLDQRPDVVIDIVDASNLDRNLYLGVQFKELGAPLLIALNMIDVAEARGISVDEEILSTMFGTPVVPIIARAHKGLDRLLDKAVELAHERQAWRPSLISYGLDIDQRINQIEEILNTGQGIEDKYHNQWLALKYLEQDKQVVDLIREDRQAGPKIEEIYQKTYKHIQSTLEDEPEGIIADYRYGFITGITKKAVKRKIESRLNLSDQIDKVLTNRIVGPLAMMFILYGIYEFTFRTSEVPVTWFESFFEWLKTDLVILIPAGNLRSMMVSGIIDGVGGVLGFIPLIMFMFFAIAILEDSGYMARMAYMLDRILRWFGLHGNSVMPLLISGGISGGCAVPGVMATRTLRDPKERIATLLVVPFMNCGAKLPIFALLISAFFTADKARMMFIFTLLSWGFALFGAKLLRATVLRGPKTPFVMELPPYRLPTLKGLSIHTWERTWQYIKKAGTIILGISIVLWALMTFPKPSPERIRFYENQMEELNASFLASEEVRPWIRDGRELEKLNDMLAGYTPDRETTLAPGPGEEPLRRVMGRIILLHEGRKSDKAENRSLDRVARKYLDLRQSIGQVDLTRHKEALESTIAGRAGSALEAVTRFIGFDYRINIALLGGFAAKEVVVSTLGTAYSLDKIGPEDYVSLSDRLRSNPDWNPLLAFTLILFTMLYVPCFVTVVSIARESSWKWAWFSMGFNLIVAYTVALIVYQAGSLLGIGV